MAQGVPTKWTREQMIEAVKECKGVISHAARKLNIHRNRIHKEVNECPEFKQIVDDLRFHYEEELLDAAESVIKYAISIKDSDLHSALKAAFFTLNNKGQKRNWNLRREESDVRSLVQDQISTNISLLYANVKGNISQS